MMCLVNFQHILAVAVGLAQCLGMELPEVESLPPKELEKGVPNPAYATALQEIGDDRLKKLGEEMLLFIPKLRSRMEAATDASEGLNIVYENLRRQRNLNFINEVIFLD